MEGKGRILVVDDNEQNRDLAEDILEDEGLQVIKGVDGYEALRLASEQLPDVILLDIMMPGIDGYEVCRRLTAPGSNTEGIMVIMITAKAHHEEIAKGLACGANDYLIKPYQPLELIARVSTQLRIKKAEDILKSSLSKAEHLSILGQMATGIAHDFNNVLSTSLVFDLVEEKTKKIKALSLEKEGPERIRKYAEEINDLCRSGRISMSMGKTLVNGIVTFAKGSSNIRETHSLEELLKPPLLMLARKIKTNKIEEKLEVDSPDIFVKCNSGEMQQVVLNLINNAIYAMETSPQKNLHIRLGKKGDKVFLTIADKGSGIPQKIQSRIFDDFFTTKPKGKGTGIGLSTVKKIVVAHEGEIDFVSTEGEGTTFTVTLPRANAL